MRPTDTWICVADGARAQFYRCDGPGRGVDPIVNLVLVSPARHHDHREQARFAGRVASQLDDAATNNLFERLVLVAPSGMLGALRHTLNAHTRRLVCGEVDKDLTRATPRELATHIGDKLPH